MFFREGCTVNAHGQCLKIVDRFRKEEMRDIRARLKGIDESIDRLLDSITPINKEFIDKKLLALGSEKKALEEKLKQLEVKPDDLVNPDQMANDIVQGLVKFRELFEQGTPEEKKELVRAFVEKLELNPETGKGALYIRQFPASIAKTGNASFNMVPGARFGADSERVPVVTARWLYAGVRQGTREMVRVGLAA